MRIPIIKAEKLKELDDSEVTQGYADGLKNEPNPGDNRTYSYWHGWRNGMVDGGWAELDKHQRALCKDVVDTGYFKNLFKKVRK